MKYLFFALSIIMILMGCSQSETIAVASNEGGEKERKMLVPGETFTVADFYILSESVLALVLKNNTEEHLSFYLDYSVKCDSSAHVSYFSSNHIALSAFETRTEWIYLHRDSRKKINGLQSRNDFR